MKLILGDCIEQMKAMPANSVKLVMGSPPYHGKMNRYGQNRKMTDREWADWMFDVVTEAVRVSESLAIIVANGCVQKGEYKPSCERLVVKCADAGIRCERPVMWHKNAPPNRKDWFGNNWEYCLAFGDKGEWNWESIAQPPKFTSGGNFRQRNGKGERVAGGSYPKNKLARPRDVLRVTVGGGHLGSDLAHENEAPYPEKLVEPFVLALTNPGDEILDPFCGSGTTLAVAERLGRTGLGIDNRESQIELSERRCAQSRPASYAG